MKHWLLICLLLIAPFDAAAAAAPPVSQPVADSRPLVFSDRDEEKRFRALAQQLRCVMCQNQSLADSNALIAQDLRREVLTLIREGRSDEQIKDFLVARYTEFVLYKPRVGPATWLLWFGPALLLLGGAVAVAVIVKRHGRGAPATAPDNDSQEW